MIEEPPSLEKLGNEVAAYLREQQLKEKEMNKEAINAQVVSYIRTLTPVIAGQIMTWLAAGGLVDETGEINAAIIAGLTMLFTAGYYIIARLLESFVSTKFGWLLGVAKKPEYTEVK